MIPVIAAFYFGSVEHYRLLASHPKVIIDIGEHYERQSYRTRTSIVGPNGVQDLNVQIVRDHGRKMPMREVGLSYKESWPQQHVHAIRSAYGQAPWFIHFIDDIEAVILKRYDRLVDLDLATMRLGMKWLGLTTEVVVSERFVEVGTIPDAVDLRGTFHPKAPLPSAVPSVRVYPQVFQERHGSRPRCSIIDLVCNMGSRSRAALLA
ncbi:MAG: WbqC family protein [Flavobacteriales bacterium]